MRELKKIIINFFDKDGFPKNRNPEHLILFLQYFIIIKEWIKNGQESVPDYLNEIIDRNMICLNSLKMRIKICLFLMELQKKIWIVFFIFIKIKLYF